MKKRSGNPQTEDGYLRISNELWDAWMCSRFNAREDRLLKVIVRFSYGLNRTFALLSKTDLAHFMNDHLPNVEPVIKSLQAKNVIKVEADSTRGLLRLTLNKHYEDWHVNQTLKRDSEYFEKVVRKMFNNAKVLDDQMDQIDNLTDQSDDPGYKSYNQTYKNDNQGYKIDNHEVINSITKRLSDLSPPGYKIYNQNQHQASEIKEENPSGIHNKNTYEDICISTTSLFAQSLSSLLTDHPFFAGLIHDETFWNALLAAYPDQDIIVQLRKMTAWLIANPEKKRPNRKRFIQAWLAKEERKEKEHGKTSPEQRRRDRDDSEEKPAPFSDIPPELIA
ncbi:MAG TPA: replication protein [Syntrophales bacterium]|nr:replication protein [Syntrophales bacterium]